MIEINSLNAISQVILKTMHNGESGKLFCWHSWVYMNTEYPKWRYGCYKCGKQKIANPMITRYN